MRSVGEIAHDLPHAAHPRKALPAAGSFGEEILQEPRIARASGDHCSPVIILICSTTFAHSVPSPAASSERARASKPLSRSCADC